MTQNQNLKSIARGYAAEQGLRYAEALDIIRHRSLHLGRRPDGSAVIVDWTHQRNAIVDTRTTQARRLFQPLTEQLVAQGHHVIRVRRDFLFDEWRHREPVTAPGMLWSETRIERLHEAAIDGSLSPEPTWLVFDSIDDISRDFEELLNRIAGHGDREGVYEGFPGVVRCIFGRRRICPDGWPRGPHYLDISAGQRLEITGSRDVQGGIDVMWRRGLEKGIAPVGAAPALAAR